MVIWTLLNKTKRAKITDNSACSAPFSPKKNGLFLIRFVINFQIRTSNIYHDTLPVSFWANGHQAARYLHFARFSEAFEHCERSTEVTYECTRLFPFFRFTYERREIDSSALWFWVRMLDWTLGTCIESFWIYLCSMYALARSRVLGGVRVSGGGGGYPPMPMYGFP